MEKYWKACWPQRNRHEVILRLLFNFLTSRLYEYIFYLQHCVISCNLWMPGNILIFVMMILFTHYDYVVCETTDRKSHEECWLGLMRSVDWDWAKLSNDVSRKDPCEFQISGKPYCGNRKERSWRHNDWVKGRNVSWPWHFETDLTL